MKMLHYIKQYYLYIITSMGIVLLYIFRNKLFLLLYYICDIFNLHVKEIHISKLKFIPINFVLTHLNLNPNIPNNVLDIDLHYAKKQINNHTFVKDLAIYRNLTGKINVYINERTPIGICEINNISYLIDEKGLIIQSYNKEIMFKNIPLIEGQNITKTTAQIYFFLPVDIYKKISYISQKNNQVNITINNKQYNFDPNLSTQDNCIKLTQYIKQ